MSLSPAAYLALASAASCESIRRMAAEAGSPDPWGDCFARRVGVHYRKALREKHGIRVEQRLP